MGSVATRSIEGRREARRPSAPWLAGGTPSTVAEAAGILERMARYCTYGCARLEDCIENDCEGWQLERAAAEFLARHWADAER